MMKIRGSHYFGFSREDKSLDRQSGVLKLQYTVTRRGDPDEELGGDKISTYIRQKVLKGQWLMPDGSASIVFQRPSFNLVTTPHIPLLPFCRYFIPCFAQNCTQSPDSTGQTRTTKKGVRQRQNSKNGWLGPLSCCHDSIFS